MSGDRQSLIGVELGAFDSPVPSSKDKHTGHDATTAQQDSREAAKKEALGYFNESLEALRAELKKIGEQHTGRPKLPWTNISEEDIQRRADVDGVTKALLVLESTIKDDGTTFEQKMAAVSVFLASVNATKTFMLDDPDAIWTTLKNIAKLILAVIYAAIITALCVGLCAAIGAAFGAALAGPAGMAPGAAAGALAGLKFGTAFSGTFLVLVGIPATYYTFVQDRPAKEALETVLKMAKQYANLFNLEVEPPQLESFKKESCSTSYESGTDYNDLSYYGGMVC